MLAIAHLLAMERGPHGIRVNTISRALIESIATRVPVATIPRFHDEALTKSMKKRIGKREAVGLCTFYLASDNAGQVTGADFAVDGGVTA